MARTPLNHQHPHAHVAVPGHASANSGPSDPLAEPAVLSFKYFQLNESGRPMTMLRRTARIDDRTLTLGKDVFPLEAVRSAQGRHNILALGLDDPASPDSDTVMVLQFSPRRVREAVRTLNRAVSRRRAAEARSRLIARGRGSLFRSCLCPGCGCTIDLSGRRVTAEVYCPYCDSVWTARDDHSGRRAEEGRQHLCDGCGLYGRPDTITCGYVIFLVVTAMYRYQIKVLCTTCMRRESWKMVGTNVIGLIGEFHAVPQLVRSYLRARPAGRQFAGLEAANGLAVGRRPERAEAAYQQIIARLGHCAGVRFNAGVARLRAGDHEQAIAHFAQALGDCANYQPAVDALARCYRRLGKQQEFDALVAHWSLDPLADPATHWAGELPVNRVDHPTA